MRRLAIGTTVGALLVIYIAIAIWLVLSGIPERMMAGVLLAAAPLVVGAYDAFRSASIERQRLVDEIRELRTEVQKSHEVL